jgi:hypothetical protein
MLVELDIFSGRPNPRWQLDESSARRLAELHHGLRPTAERTPDPPGLGYRGFVYTVEDATWRAWKGSVVGPGQVLADPDITIERWFLDQLPAEYADLRPRIAAELEPTG